MNQIPLQKNKNFYQGVFVPKNRNKYIGKNNPIYRSGWELRFFRFCDTSDNVLEWGSEAVIVPYVSPIDKKVHRYYTDGIIAIREGDTIKKYIVEIKPKKQTLPPTKKGRKKQKTLIYEIKQYAVNQAKWAAATQWAKKNNLEFIILTEEHLGLRCEPPKRS